MEVVGIDVGDAAKENLRRQHMHLYNHNVFIHKTGFVMSVFVHSYMYGVGHNKVTATLHPILFNRWSLFMIHSDAA